MAPTQGLNLGKIFARLQADKHHRAFISLQSLRSSLCGIVVKANGHITVTVRGP